ncbi:hypothetical protein C6495_07195 [Candidatus Poribacteria bacterium]|nr:MAG: hypothetical protein C6495_07195 [Candidatus Poribacteria bacterium]
MRGCKPRIPVRNYNVGAVANRAYGVRETAPTRENLSSGTNPVGALCKRAYRRENIKLQPS